MDQRRCHKNGCSHGPVIIVVVEILTKSAEEHLNGVGIDHVADENS